MPAMDGDRKSPGRLRAAAALLAAAALVLGGCGSPGTNGPDPLRVFGAASLADALVEAAAAFEAVQGMKVELNLAGSSSLARQIVAGAPADDFLSADPVQMEVVVAAGRIGRRDVVDLLGNRLVVIVPAASRTAALAGPAGLLDFDHLALADPTAVPAGVYARTWLEGLGLWHRLEARVVPAGDVRAALAAVAGGHLPAGIVYATDAASTDGVRVVYRVPEGEGPAIRYQAGVVAGLGPERRAAAEAWQRFLAGAAAPIFERHGFTMLRLESDRG
ncbi:MAG: molybdate ABC transporter substrate-binding protein [Acidobacteria bacterium]|nr:molybdate ABC transporter substrate-binding protein [Acidobacteriota bacterium]